MDFFYRFVLYNNNMFLLVVVVVLQWKWHKPLERVAIAVKSSIVKMDSEKQQ